MFSIGIAPAHPFLMSEQSPRIIKLRQSVYARSNIQPLRQTEISFYKLKFNFLTLRIIIRKIE